MELPSLIQRLRAKGWKDIEQICEKYANIEEDEAEGFTTADLEKYYNSNSDEEIEENEKQRELQQPHTHRVHLCRKSVTIEENEKQRELQQPHAHRVHLCRKSVTKLPIDVLINAGQKDDNNPNAKVNTIVRRVKARTFRSISDSEDDDMDIDMQYRIHKTVKIKVRRSDHSRRHTHDKRHHPYMYTPYPTFTPYVTLHSPPYIPLHPPPFYTPLYGYPLIHAYNNCT